MRAVKDRSLGRTERKCNGMSSSAPSRWKTSDDRVLLLYNLQQQATKCARSYPISFWRVALMVYFVVQIF